MLQRWQSSSVRLLRLPALSLILILALAGLGRMLGPSLSRAQAPFDPHLVNPRVGPPGLEWPPQPPTAPEEQPNSRAPDAVTAGDGIFFTSDRGNGGIYAVYAMNTDGTGQTRLTSSMLDADLPKVSTTSHLVAFGAATADGNWDIYIMDPSGVGQTRLTNSPYAESWPDWSPDGKRIAYTRQVSGRSEIWIMNADGTGQHSVAYAPNGQYDAFPSWSGDGTRLVFMRSNSAELSCSINWDIWVMSADGTAQTRLTDNGLGDLYPAWSRYNGKITYTACRNTGGFFGRNVPSIWIMSSNGGSKLQITDSSSGDWGSSWTPYADRILFSTARDGQDEVYSIPSGGGTATNLTRAGGSDQGPAWGNRTAYPPIPDFDGSPRSGAAPLSVVFTEHHQGTVHSRTWYFGDGQTSNSQNPWHTYAQPGLYDVLLNVTGPSGSNSVIKRGYIAIPPTPQFSAAPVSGLAPLAVAFTNQSSGTVTAYYWDFGDHSNSSVANPVHTYLVPGRYTVSLTVTGPGGSATQTEVGLIGIPPTAEFSGAPRSGRGPLEVHFADQSFGQVDGRYWTFGDGESSTEPAPTHSYRNPGSYEVSLAVQGPGGTNLAIKSGYILVAPRPYFSAEGTTGCIPLRVRFSGRASGEVTSWRWDFGDGTTSTEQYPEHVYEEAGKYSVSLTVSGPTGSDSVTEPDLVEATDSLLLEYDGSLNLPDARLMIDEVDNRISMGDHVHLKLPFKNLGCRPITGASVKVTGAPQMGSAPSLAVFNGSDWGGPDEVALVPSTIKPDETGYAYFWIAISNLLPKIRSTDEPGLKLGLSNEYGDWQLAIRVEPIHFIPDTYADFTAEDCLHHPGDFGIQTYAQYAAGSKELYATSNADDPDTALQSLRNLGRVVSDRTNFNYGDGPWRLRTADTDLLTTLGATIGQCRHYADLTIGLLRSLGIPARYVRAALPSNNPFKPNGHAWVEAWLDDWVRVDTTWGGMGNGSVGSVDWVRADRHPLSTANSYLDNTTLCIPACFTAPVDCPTCIRDSNVCPLTTLEGHQCPNPLFPDLSCTEDVTSRYRTQAAALPVGAAANALLLKLDSPVAITRTVPFNVSSSITNLTGARLASLNAGVVTGDAGPDGMQFFDAQPTTQQAVDVAPGQTITFTWTLIPRVAGHLAVQISATAIGQSQSASRPVLAQEPGGAPVLALSSPCSSPPVQPGKPVTLTVDVRDAGLQPLQDAGTLVTASLVSRSQAGYSSAFTLPYCASCGGYQKMVVLPSSAPLGRYEITYTATRAGYQPGQTKSNFTVVPALDLQLAARFASASMTAPLDIRVDLRQRDLVVRDAGVTAQILMPGETITLPLFFEGTTYSTSRTLTDLAAVLGRPVPLGRWTIRATANYRGAATTAEVIVNTLRPIYLPTVIRNW